MQSPVQQLTGHQLADIAAIKQEFVQIKTEYGAGHHAQLQQTQQQTHQQQMILGLPLDEPHSPASITSMSLYEDNPVLTTTAPGSIGGGVTLTQADSLKLLDADSIAVLTSSTGATTVLTSTATPLMTSTAPTIHSTGLSAGGNGVNTTSMNAMNYLTNANIKVASTLLGGNGLTVNGMTNDLNPSDEDEDDLTLTTNLYNDDFLENINNWTSGELGSINLTPISDLDTASTSSGSHFEFPDYGTPEVMDDILGEGWGDTSLANLINS